MNIKLLQNISQTQHALVLDGDILIVYLVKYIMDNQRTNIKSEWLTAAKLYKQLDGRAEVDRSDTLLRNEFRARYDNSISLGKRLSNIKSDISDFIKIETGKNRGNVTVYRISEGKHFDDLKNGLQV